jgi:hypothetical protein
MKFPDPRKMSKSELNARYSDAQSLLDGCYDIIELYVPRCPSQVEWRRKWLEAARSHGAEPML